MANDSSHIFGPVPSRRLGRSLGIDLVPYKTCTYDCVYCQLGPTTQCTVERREWVPLDAVLSELEQKLDTEPDYLTLSGSGEPTLYSRIGDLITGIRAMTSIPIAALTNGSLLYRPEVRESLRDVDLVVPSLDAPDDALFQQVNRPHPDVHFDDMVEGLIAFRDEFDGQYWLEVFVLDDITANDDAITRMAEIARRIRPDQVQLNTIARPPAEPYARAASIGDLERWAALFGDNAEVIADAAEVHKAKEFTARREDLLALLSRRPCTVDGIAEGLGIHRNEVVKYVDDLLSNGEITTKTVDGLVHYAAR